MSRIWVPRCKIIEPRDPLAYRMGFAGFFRLRVIAPHHGTVRRDTGWFRNVITNQGLDYIGDGTQYFNRFAVGTGTSAPAFTDTQLESQIATASLTSGTVVNAAQGSEPYFGSSTQSGQFGQGVAAGNLTEIGIGRSSGTPVPLFSRALILDNEGNPTTLTVQEDEFLEASYQLRVFPPLEDIENEITISGDTYDKLARASLVTTSTVWPGGASLGPNVNGTFGTNGQRVYDAVNSSLGAITGEPSGTGPNFDNRTSVSLANYTNGTHLREQTATWGLSDGNMANGVGQCRLMWNCGAVQASFDPPIPKDNTKVLTLTARISWARQAS